MTTIVFRTGIMAADSRASSESGFILPGVERKLVRMHDGGVAGLIGALARSTQLLHWLQAGGFPDNRPSGEGALLVMRSKGTITHYEDGYEFEETLDPFMAWGSGRAVALGALHAGASAAEAVRIAGLVDPYTGGQVHTMSVEGSDEAV